MVCNPSEAWSSCSHKVKSAIQAAKTPEEAVAAASEWAARYKALYVAHASANWTTSDQDRLEQAGDSLFDEAIGQYLDPAALAFSLALKRYFPSLSACLGLVSNPFVVAFYALLAPSPIANDFTAATPENNDINRLLFQKINSFMPPGWDDQFARMREAAYLSVRPGSLP